MFLPHVQGPRHQSGIAGLGGDRNAVDAENQSGDRFIGGGPLRAALRTGHVRQRRSGHTVIKRNIQHRTMPNKKKELPKRWHKNNTVKHLASIFALFKRGTLHSKNDALATCAVPGSSTVL